MNRKKDYLPNSYRLPYPIADEAIMVNKEDRSSFKIQLIPELSPFERQIWEPFVQDHDTQSYSYLLPASSFISSSFASKQDLDRWFQELHPSKYDTDDAWTIASYKGETLLRKTAWCVFEDQCVCEYGYSDTWQKRLQNPKMKQVLKEITNAVSEAIFGKEQNTKTVLVPSFNSCNLNYYPQGGGVGFHADDEFLFDGLEQSVRIVSLSLAAPNENPNKDDNPNCWGSRIFQVRKKEVDEDGDSSNPKHNTTSKIKEILLGHGDLMTMEGFFQKFYLHSVWPGDSKDYCDSKYCQGERINLTWRTIVKHLDGSEACRGRSCPLALPASQMIK